jgi:hypothetical protein
MTSYDNTSHESTVLDASFQQPPSSAAVRKPHPLQRMVGPPFLTDHRAKRLGSLKIHLGQFIPDPDDLTH